MTLSLYSTCKAMCRDAGAGKRHRSEATSPVQDSVRHALALLGMGVEGVSCGGDIRTPPSYAKIGDQND